MRHRMLLFAAAAVLFTALAGSLAAAAEKIPQVWLNEDAPDITLTDVRGKNVSLSDFKGKNAVIVSFWHPENQSCISQYQELKKILKDKKYSSVKVLAITFGKEKEQRDAAVKKFAEANLDFTILFEKKDDNTASTVKLMVTWLPAFYIIDIQGRLATPMLSNVTEKTGGMAFTDMLASAMKGKRISACTFSPEKHSDEDSYKKVYDLIGKKAPDFAGTDQNGEKQSPSFYRGFKNVVVLFWSPGCPHCRRELPQINAYLKRWGDKQNAKILSVVLDPDEKGKEASREFFKQFGIKLSMVFDEGNKIAPQYGVNSVPTMFLVDKKGIVRQAFVGEFAAAADVLQCEMAKLK